MTSRHIIELDIIFFLIVSASIGIVFALYSTHKPNVRNTFSLPVMQNFQSPAFTPISTLVPVPKVETLSQVSPDGIKNLTMTITSNKDRSKTYEFISSEVAKANKQSIYSSTLSRSEKMTIPFNTWSPDNAYVFVQNDTSSNSAALVMQANGQPFADGEQYFNVAAIFTAKNTGYTYQETIGWASNTLLIVNTTRPDGSKGPSYWFEVPSKAIIQLSTEF